MAITICNYDLYQDPKNYESHTKADTKATMKPQGTDTINKNDKNVKNKEEYIRWRAETRNESYKILINFILGDNVLGEELTEILNMDTQITEERFVKLIKAAQDNGVRLTEKIIGLENHQRTATKSKKYKDFTLTLNNWVNYKK
jgi:hypothetical protein